MNKFFMYIVIVYYEQLFRSYLTLQEHNEHDFLGELGRDHGKARGRYGTIVSRPWF